MPKQTTLILVLATEKMLLSETPSLSDFVDKRCPHLGLRDDPATAFYFPSEWNYCHSVKPIAPPSLVYQREVCLTTAHIFCIAIDARQKKSLPKDMRRREVGATHKLIGRWITVVVILTFIIMGGLIFSGYWAPSWVERTSIPFSISRVIPQKTMTNTPTVVIVTDAVTPEKSIVSETPGPSKEDIAATQIKLALASRCAYPLEKPFGNVNRKFLLHKVVEGENMTILTERYETTPNAIEAINNFYSSSLWAESVIVIPLNLTNIDGLPSFKPVLLDEEDISLEELAQNLLVSSVDLIEYNQLDPSCRSFQGWVLVPGEKITQ